MAKRRPKKTERTKGVSVALTKTIQHETYGGARFTSTTLFESESEEVPTSLDTEEVLEVWTELRRRVEERIEIRTQALIESIKANAPH